MEEQRSDNFEDIKRQLKLKYSCCASVCGG